MPPTIGQLLNETVRQGASELHLTLNSPPQIRVDGSLRPLNFPGLNAVEVTACVESCMNDGLKVEFAEKGRVRYEFWLKGLGQFEVHVYRQRSFPSAVYKAVPFEIRGLKELGLPPFIERMQGGLHLIGGMSGSGRSTTLAALVDKVNREEAGKLVVVSLEAGPWHSHKKSLVDQILVGEDVASLEEAMEVVLATRTDLIAVDGVRTPKDWSHILHVAQSGLPVLATCTGRNKASLLQEIVLLFPPHQQNSVRRRLAQTLNWVVVQTLLPKASGRGRVLGSEYLHVTREVRNLIQSNQMTRLNVPSKEFTGWSWSQHLAYLYFGRMITLETVFTAAEDLASSGEDLQEVINAGPGSLLEYFPYFNTMPKT